jgi:hypothetical protein
MMKQVLNFEKLFIRCVTWMLPMAAQFAVTPDYLLGFERRSLLIVGERRLHADFMIELLDMIFSGMLDTVSFCFAMRLGGHRNLSHASGVY